jgi:hypothetical protein
MRRRRQTAAPRLPPVVRVGPFDMAVVKLDAAAGKDDFGQFSADRLEIRLRENFVSPHLAADTVIHEVLHALWWVMDVRPKAGEEHVVTLLSTGLTQFFRDNPAVLAWLRESLARPGAARKRKGGRA